jgi:hypothetical protein
VDIVSRWNVGSPWQIMPIVPVLSPFQQEIEPFRVVETMERVIKLMPKWTEPFKVVETVCEYVYKVEHLNIKRVE